MSKVSPDLCDPCPYSRGPHGAGIACVQSGVAVLRLHGRECPLPPPQKITGAGDVLAAVTKKLGIKQCGGCKRRQKILNEIITFKKTKKEN